MERRDARNIMEALLFITEQPVPLKSFVDLFDQQFAADELERMVMEISQQYQEQASPLELPELAGGCQFAARPEFAPWIRKVLKDRLPYRLNTPAEHTHSINPANQAITR